MTTAEQVAEIIAERYPCQVLPIGAITDIAAELNVTKQRVSQITTALGFSGHKGQRPAPVMLCGACGEPLNPGNKYGFHSGACRRVTLPCADCGKPVTRTVAQIVRNARATEVMGKPIKSHGNVFCNNSCKGHYTGKHYGWGAA